MRKDRHADLCVEPLPRAPEELTVPDFETFALKIAVYALLNLDEVQGVPEGLREPELRTTAGTAPSVQTAPCNPATSASNVSLAASATYVQPLKLSTHSNKRWGNASPWIVTPNPLASVKSRAPSRPGTAVCSKYASRSGPCCARQSRTRRCSVRTWPGSNRPGNRSHNQSNSVSACSRRSVSAASRGTTSVAHRPSKGSARVRHVRAVFVPDGNGPSCHRWAVRSHMPAAAAAAPIVLPFIRFSLNRRTCASVTNPSSLTDSLERRNSAISGPANLIVVARQI